MITGDQAKDAKARCGFRNADKPAIVPACRNCIAYLYDAEDRFGPSGETFTRSNQRCHLHLIRVSRNTVCNDHQFKHRDRRDA